MEAFILDIQPRDLGSKGTLRRLRKDGLLPAVVYEKGGKSLPAAVVNKDFSLLARRSKGSQLFVLKSEDRELNGKRAVVREVQQDYRSGHVLHIDFHALREDEKLHIAVAITLTGEAPGVKLGGGVLSFVTHAIEVFCLPKDIPAKLELDVSGLQLGQSLHARDIPLPPNVEIRDPEETIVAVAAVRSTETEAKPATKAAPAAASAAKK